MLCQSLVFLLSALLLANANSFTNPVANPKPNPVADSPPATSSVTPSQLSTTVFFASEQCEYTSSSNTIGEGKCADLTIDTGTVSYRLGFTRGGDFPGDNCSVLFYSTNDCSGSPNSTVAASSLSDTCYVETGNTSVQLICC